MNYKKGEHITGITDSGKFLAEMLKEMAISMNRMNAEILRNDRINECQEQKGQETYQTNKKQQS